MTESPEESPAADRRPAGPDVEAEAEPEPADAEADGGDSRDGDGADTDAELDALREQVEETYDFENFGPADMADMSLDEWEAAFDPETWIVGEELLDRVEQELNARVAIREIFAVVERVTDGEDRVIAYSDEGYAVIYADGSVEGEGTVLRDVKPTVALCSMDSYDLMEPPAGGSLPDPREVVEGSGEFGNLMLQIVAGVQVAVGVGLLIAWLALPSLSTVVAPIAAIGFIVIGVFLFVVVANARLSDRFRVEEFRNRLRALENADERWADALPEELRDAGVGPADDRAELDAGEGAAPDDRAELDAGEGAAPDGETGVSTDDSETGSA